jgi:Flp pilus assembly protein TadG
MRVTRRSLNDEAGVSAVLIVLALTFLLGMVSLSVDGGFLFLKRRAMVNANDAASLGAALSCAKGDGQGGLNGADWHADDLAVRNVPGATRFAAPVYTPSCNAPAGKVTVSYQANQALFFSQVVGVSSPKVVRAQSTATWGAAGAAADIVPLMLSSNGGLGDCDIPVNVVIGQHCKFWWDNDLISNAQWGILDVLGGWDVTRTGSCTGNLSANDVKQLIAGTMSAGTLSMREPPPTYACVSSGFQGNSLTNAIATNQGKLVVMPVNDAFQQVTSSGALCPPGSTCTVGKYAIIGFATLEIYDAAQGQQAKTLCPGHTGNNGSVRCLDLIWRGYQSGGLTPGGGTNFGTVAVTLSG